MVFNCLYMFSWVSVGPEGCRGLNWIRLATCGHRAMTGISPLAMLTGRQSRFLSGVTTSSQLCDLEHTPFWPKLK